MPRKSAASLVALLVAIFTMIAFALIAWLRLRDGTKDRGVIS